MKKNIFSIFSLGLVVALSIFASCNKLSNKTAINPPGFPPVVTPDSVVLKPGVIVIDSTRLTLVSTAGELAAGTYAYKSSTGFPSFISGSIIIGITGDGYLRKVTSVSSGSGMVTLTTTPARLEDVFMQANLNFTTDISNMMRKTEGGYQYDMNNVSLFHDGTASVNVTSGTISIMPNWNFNIHFQEGALTGFSALCSNGTLYATAQINVTSSGADNISGSSELNAVSGRNIIWIGQLPIVVSTSLTYAANVSGSVAGAVNHDFSFTTNDTYTLGDTYASGTWTNQYNYAHTTTMTDNALSGYNLSCSITPQMTVKIFGVVCPSASNALSTMETSSASSFSGGFTAQQMFSVSGSILGYSISDDSFTRLTDTTAYTTTSTAGGTFLKVSGDGQIGAAYSYLAAPLVVRVVDNFGVAQAGITVDFTVTSGGGHLSYYSVTTNSDGYAQTNWQIGNPATSQQRVEAVARTSGGIQIGSTLTFIAL